MAKLQRFNPWPIFLYNSRASKREGVTRLNWSERGLLYGGPTLGLTLFVIFRLQLNGIPQLLAATSLLAGAMISVFVFLANLRIKIQEVDSYNVRRDLKELVASSAVGSLHVAVIAMLLALCLALMASWPLLTTDTLAGNIVSGIAIWFLVHLAISLAAVLRRLLGIYVDLFTADFTARPEPDNRPIGS